ncbi:helix-turn-helix domain-containing protein [Streptosporangium sp. NPDC051022]|uniref:TetR/AcrR family transcriptional regulator n=1 Tax=Streptosporangium sp. NPDC051022 TaxID=3155752 RepID=UPI0034360703
MARIEADFEDLTARARIRDAALRHFGEHGFERATIRGIAETAGVSSGLVRHHFGSKQALREACDEFLVKEVRRLNDEARAVPVSVEVNPVAAALAALGPYRRYLARALAEGWAEPLFDEMVRMSEEWLEEVDRDRPDPPFAGRGARAAVGTAMALAVPLLHRHLSRSLGVDLFSPEGAHQLAVILLDIHSHPMLTPEAAASMREALEKLRPTSP